MARFEEYREKTAPLQEYYKQSEAHYIELHVTDAEKQRRRSIKRLWKNGLNNTRRQDNMRIFSISDLHLPGNADKPMDIFGAQWENHWDKIQSNWREMVDEEDCVLIPGDISWAMKLEDAIGDLEEIGRLPGKKIIIRGNHDFWWSSISKVRRALPQSHMRCKMTVLNWEGLGFVAREVGCPWK